MSGLRVPWRGFPDVAAHTTITKMKASPDYLGAKTGDLAAAVRLAKSALKPDKLGLLPPFDFIVPVQQVERGSSNALPLGLAVALLPHFPGVKLLNTVVQTNVVTHTGADAAARLTSQPLFGGPVLPGRYLLVDDVVTFGSTLANLRGHLEFRGAQAVAAVTLGASLFSTRLAPHAIMLDRINQRHAPVAELFLARTGFPFEHLTNKEAYFLDGIRSPDRLGSLLAAELQRPAAARDAGAGLRPAGRQPGDLELARHLRSVKRSRESDFER